MNTVCMYACKHATKITCLMFWQNNLYKDYVGYKALLYNIDGWGYSYLACGYIPGVYAIVDFRGQGINKKWYVHLDPSYCTQRKMCNFFSFCYVVFSFSVFNYMRKIQKRRPFVNSEDLSITLVDKPILKGSINFIE